MQRHNLIHILPVLLVILLLTACGPGEPTAAPTAAVTPTRPPTAIAPTSTPLIRPSSEPATPEPTPDPYPIGPLEFPASYNPLTGLPVDDPAVLQRRPLLIKVSNESNEVRPQSGLSFADHVWIYQMEGWAQTRFTAVIYSQTPPQVGSVRSVRLIDSEHLVDMYDALLVISGGSIGMNYVLSQKPWYDRIFFDQGDWLQRIPDVPRPYTARYHTLFAIPERVWAEADARGVNGPPDLQGLLFDPQPPEGGIPTTGARVDYPKYGPAQRWAYDPASGSWLSFTEVQIEVRPVETPDVDYLTNEQLAFENVVILYAEHSLANFIEDEPNQLAAVDINLIGEGDAVLLRDGLRYEVRWQRENPGDMMRLVDADGDPVAFKPGQTWWMVAGIEPGIRPDVTFSD